MVEPPPREALREVTRLLDAVAEGEREAAEHLLPLLYGDLRRLAAARMARLGPGQTLQATALVYEAYLRLVGSADPGWQGRAHFFAAAARAMRDIVADHLRRKSSLKRGGHFRRVGEETAAELSSEGPDEDVLAVEEALQDLEPLYPRKAPGPPPLRPRARSVGGHPRGASGRCRRPCVPLCRGRRELEHLG